MSETLLYFVWWRFCSCCW